MITEKPEAIMISLPERFFTEYPGGIHKFQRLMMFDVNEGKCVWHNTISNVPVHNVLHCFLVYRGIVVMRANIMEYVRKAEMTFNDGGVKRSFGKRNWVLLTGPVVFAKSIIPQKGFRGFRYCQKYF